MLLDPTERLIGVDYFTHHEVRRIVENTYPSLNISRFKATLFIWNTRLSSSKDQRLQHILLSDLQCCKVLITITIWDSSTLGDYDYKPHKFDCDDFAVCMKDAVSKYSHDRTKPDNRGSLCGIMCGRNMYS